MKPFARWLALTSLAAHLAASGSAAAQAVEASGGLVIRPLAPTAEAPVLRAIPQGEAAPIPATAPDATTPAQPAAPVARQPGLPLPSIVVGEQASLLAPGRRSPLGVPRDVRDRIRQLDPALFERRLDGGGFDPDAGQFASSIQTDLAGLGCYGGAIDGAWGAGSTAALGRMLDAAGADGINDAQPDADLFRTIAGIVAVRCAAPAPTPVAAAPRTTTPADARRPSGTATSPARSAPVVRSTPVRAQPVQPQVRQPQAQTVAPPATPQINPGFGGSGIFR